MNEFEKKLINDLHELCVIFHNLQLHGLLDEKEKKAYLDKKAEIITQASKEHELLQKIKKYVEEQISNNTIENNITNVELSKGYVRAMDEILYRLENSNEKTHSV